MLVDFCSFNVRGLNKKHAHIKDFISANKISFVALLETRVQECNASSIAARVAINFNWLFNYEHHDGGRIWVGWNPNFWKISLIQASSQHISCKVEKLDSKEVFVVSFIYGLNNYIDRRRLWEELSTFKFLVDLEDMSWCVLGDFNAILSLDEAVGGNPIWDNSMADFNEFVFASGLTDLRSCGSEFTWWDKSFTSPKYRKIDRVMVNAAWLTNFSASLAYFLPRGVSDHNPAAVNIGSSVHRLKKPFQMFNHLIEHPDFLDSVKEAWGENVVGDPWWILTNKLKRVKHSMLQLNKNVGNLHLRVSDTRNKLTVFQANLPSSPSLDQLVNEAKLIDDYNAALKEEESLLCQKSRIKWLDRGDGNNRYFFNYCRGRWNSNKIMAIENENGDVLESHEEISSIAVDFFKKSLGSTFQVNPIPDDLELPVLSAAQSSSLSAPFTAEEVWSVL